MVHSFGVEIKRWWRSKINCKETKKIPPSQIIDFFNSQRPYNKFDLTQQTFLEDLVLYITKGYQPLSSIENPWLKHLILHQCGHIKFPTRH
jgi:hypothetical protein